MQLIRQMLLEECEHREQRSLWCLTALKRAGIS